MKVEQIITSGWGLNNNVWFLADNQNVVIIDAPHHAGEIMQQVGARTVAAILFTHAHPDHINASKELKRLTKAPMYLHPDDKFMWQQFNKDIEPNLELADGQTLSLAGEEIKVIHTPGHTPGGVSFYWERGKTLFSGDTLFPGGPGATKWEYSSFEAIIESIKTKLFVLPEDTEVLAGHGKPTTIGTEKLALPDWIKRGF